MNNQRLSDETSEWKNRIVLSSMAMTDLPGAVEIEQTTIYSPWSREMFQKEIEAKNPGLKTFRLENQLIGYFCFWKVLNEAHLLNLTLRSDFRGKGLGRFLMRRLEQTCKEMDISKIVLEVAETNYVALALYKNCGFIKVGVRKRFYQETGDDAILMEKRIQRR
jgi:ribosomal-protein-alanine N-acetyltransferase